jgi:CheY-like chemotaxis protein
MDGVSNPSRPADGLGAMHVIGDSVPPAFDALASRAAPVAESPPAILVVDGDPDVRQLLERLVQHLAPDYDIIASTDPVEALERMCGRSVLLVITNFSMPLLDSLRLTACVKGRTPETHVLLITINPSPVLEQQARHQGIAQYLSKPFAFADLERALETALPRG